MPTGEHYAVSDALHVCMVEGCGNTWHETCSAVATGMTCDALPCKSCQHQLNMEYAERNMLATEDDERRQYWADRLKELLSEIEP